MLLSALLTTLLLAGPALADRDDRRDHRRGWDDRDRREHHDRSRYDNRRYWRDDRWRDGRWGHPGGRHWRRGWQRGWYYAPPPRRFRRHDDRGAVLIGGAIIGSVLTQGLTQRLTHDRGDHHRCDHGRSTIVSPGSCYRIERLPGGRERRVPLPPSACRW